MWSVVQDEAAGYEQGHRRRSISARSPEPEDPDFEEEVCCSTLCRSGHNRPHANACVPCLTVVSMALPGSFFCTGEEELKRAALDNISKSQKTFKYPIKETEDVNGKVSHRHDLAMLSMCLCL